MLLDKVKKKYKTRKHTHRSKAHRSKQTRRKIAHRSKQTRRKIAHRSKQTRRKIAHRSKQTRRKIAHRSKAHRSKQTRRSKAHRSKAHRSKQTRRKIAHRSKQTRRKIAHRSKAHRSKAHRSKAHRSKKKYNLKGGTRTKHKSWWSVVRSWFTTKSLLDYINDLAKNSKIQELAETVSVKVKENLNNHRGLGRDIYPKLVNKTPPFNTPFPDPSPQVLELLEKSVTKLEILGFIKVNKPIPASGTDKEPMTLSHLTQEVLDIINNNVQQPSREPPPPTVNTASPSISAVPNIDYLVLAFIILEYNKTKTKTKIEPKTGDKQLTLDEKALFTALDTPNCSLFAVWIMGLIDKETLIVLTVLMSIQNINSKTKDEVSISLYMKNIMVMEDLMDEPEHDIYIHIPKTELDQPNTASMMKSLVSQIVSPGKKVFMRIFEYEKNGFRIPHVCVVEHTSGEVIEGGVINVYDPQVSLFNSDYGTSDTPIFFEDYLTLAIQQDYDTLIFNVNGEYSGEEWQDITLADYDVFESKVFKTKIPDTERKKTLELLKPLIQRIPEDVDITVGLKLDE